MSDFGMGRIQMTSQITTDLIDFMPHSKFGPNRTGSFWQVVLKKMTDSEVRHPKAISKKMQPDGEHNRRRYHCPDASYQKWFQLDWTLRDDFVYISKKGKPLDPPPYLSLPCQTKINNWTCSRNLNINSGCSVKQILCQDNAGFGGSLSPSRFTEADQNGEHNTTRPHHTYLIPNLIRMGLVVSG